MSSSENRPTSNARPYAGLAATAALVALLAAVPGHAAPKKGKGTVSGTVTSKTGGEALSGVQVTLEDAEGVESTTATDKRGHFSIKVLSGDYLIALEREGYARFEARLPVLAGGEQAVTIELLDAAEGRRSEAAAAYNMGVEAYRSGDAAAAKSSFLAAIEADPTLPEPHGVLAGIYFEEGAWAEAAAEAETFLAVKPGDRQAMLTAYEAYRKLNDADRIVEKRAQLAAADAELTSKLAVQAFNEGAIANRDGDGETAMARFKEALALDDTLAAAHFAVSTAHFQAGRYDEAMAALETGLALEPTSAQGLRLRFLIHDVKGELEAADEAMDAYSAVDAAGAAAVLFKRGEMDFRAGELEPARKALTKLLGFWPDHAAAHRVLGLAYLTSDTEKATAHLKRFLELAPGDPEAATVEEILASL